MPSKRNNRPEASSKAPRLAQLSARVFMASSVFTRMIVGLGVFVILARSLGPADFGLISATMAYAGLAGLISDFGLSIKMLRELAADASERAATLADGLMVKVSIVLLFVAAGALVFVILPLPVSGRIACALFALGVLVGSVGDMALVAYRATGHYGREAITVAWTSVFYVAAVMVAALMGGGPREMGLAFLVARLLYACLAVRGAFRLCGGAPGRRPSLRNLGQSLRGSLSWAADSGLGYLNGQLDALLLPYVVGLGPAGIYLAANRFVLASTALAAVLSNIHIPQLAAAATVSESGRRERRMFIEFALLGAAFGLFFLFGGPLLAAIALGPAYVGVNQLWPGFAAFVFARYVAAGIGSGLAARGHPKLRVGGQIAGLLTLLAGMALWLPSEGPSAMPWIMAAGAAATFVAYAVGRAIVSGKAA